MGYPEGMLPISDEMLQAIQAAITLPFCLLAVLIVHELGHYMAARFLNLRVGRVSFGFGRLLWSKTDRHGTVWLLHLWPLRAHVSIVDFESPSLSLRKKLSVILAGPAANFALPFILFFLFFASSGQPATPNVITAVERTMPAYEAGMLPGDKILSINGVEVRSMADVLAFTSPKSAQPLEIVYEREGDIRTASVLPLLVKYRDVDGLWREHGRIGLVMSQQAHSLHVVRAVNGVATATDEKVREELLKHMGQRIEIGLFGRDGKIHDMVLDLSPESNRDLGDPESSKSNRVYFGALRTNVYLPMTVAQSAAASIEQSREMIWNVLRIPFNLFPINPEWVRPEAVVSEETSFLHERFYVFVFFASLCSCFIGLLNLLPFPKLDGGEILMLASAAWKRRPLLSREKARVFIVSLLFFYAAVFGANMNDFRGYFLFQIDNPYEAENIRD